MTKTILNVEGMTCGSCIAQVKDTLALGGVSRVEVNLADGTVAVDHEPSISAGRLIAALQLAGYEATPRRDDRPGHV